MKTRNNYLNPIFFCLLFIAGFSLHAQPELCNDLIDNDLDGLIDCMDPDCAADPICAGGGGGGASEDCGDGIDNDSDGMIDCADSDCSNDPMCPSGPVNDMCSGAIAIGDYSTCNFVSLDLTTATNSGWQNQCTPDKDLWYSFVATSSAIQITSDPSNAQDLIIDLYASCDNTSFAIACEYIRPNSSAHDISGLTLGNTYYIKASMSGGSTLGGFCITPTCAIDLVNVVVGACDPLTNEYTADLTIALENLPAKNNLHIQVVEKLEIINVPPGTDTLYHQVTGLNSSGLPSSISIVNNGGSFCNYDDIFVPPAPCGTPPSNDLCANAIPISDLSNCNTHAFDMAGADKEDFYFTCGPLVDIWYTFVPDTSVLKIDFHETPSFFGTMAFTLYSDCVSPPISSCNYVHDGQTTEITGLVPGMTYYMSVGMTRGSSGEFCIYKPQQAPANDLCINAEPITYSNTCNFISVDTENATNTFNPFQCNGEADVWYEFSATSSAIQIISGSNAHMFIEIYDQCDPNAMPVECLFVFPFATNNNVQGLTTGVNYYLKVSMGFGVTQGSFCMTPTCGLELVSATASVCDPVTNDYSLDIALAVENMPQPNNLTFDVGGVNETVSIPSGVDTLYHQIQGINATGLPITLSIVNFDGAFCGIAPFIGTTPSPCVSSPTNDLCSNAIAITDFDNCTPIDINIDGATLSEGMCGPFVDIWYSFVADTTELRLDFNEVPSSYGTLAVSLLDGCGGVPLMQCRKVPNGTSTDLKGLTVGNTYYLMINYLHGSSGNICLYRPVPPSCDLTVVVNSVQNESCQGFSDGFLSVTFPETSDDSVSYQLYKDQNFFFSGIGNDLILGGLEDGVYDIAAQLYNDPSCFIYIDSILIQSGDSTDLDGNMVPDCAEMAFCGDSLSLPVMSYQVSCVDSFMSIAMIYQAGAMPNTKYNIDIDAIFFDSIEIGSALPSVGDTLLLTILDVPFSTGEPYSTSGYNFQLNIYNCDTYDLYHTEYFTSIDCPVPSCDIFIMPDFIASESCFGYEDGQITALISESSPDSVAYQLYMDTLPIFMGIGNEAYIGGLAPGVYTLTANLFNDPFCKTLLDSIVIQPGDSTDLDGNMVPDCAESNLPVCGMATDLPSMTYGLSCAQDSFVSLSFIYQGGGVANTQYFIDVYALVFDTLVIDSLPAIGDTLYEILLADYFGNASAFNQGMPFMMNIQNCDTYELYHTENFSGITCPPAPCDISLVVQNVFNESCYNFHDGSISATVIETSSDSVYYSLVSNGVPVVTGVGNDIYMTGLSPGAYNLEVSLLNSPNCMSSWDSIVIEPSLYSDTNLNNIADCVEALTCGELVGLPSMSYETSCVDSFMSIAIIYEGGGFPFNGYLVDIDAIFQEFLVVDSPSKQIGDTIFYKVLDVPDFTSEPYGNPGYSFQMNIYNCDTYDLYHTEHFTSLDCPTPLCDIAIIPGAITDETCQGIADGSISATITETSPDSVAYQLYLDTLPIYLGVGNTVNMTDLAPGAYTLTANLYNDPFCKTVVHPIIVQAGDSLDANLNMVPDCAEVGNNYSLDFDGVDDYLEFTDIPESQTYSFEFWVKFDAVEHDIRILSNISSPLNFYFLSISGTKLSTFRAPNVLHNVSTTDIQPNTWYHIAYSRKSSTEVDFYLNGVQEVPTLTITSDITFFSNMNIGSKYNNQHGKHFDGQIDEFRIWEGPISQQQILDNMNKELTGGESDLVAYYKFDGDHPDQAFNCSSDPIFGNKYGPVFSPDQPIALSDTLCLSCGSWTYFLDFDNDGFGNPLIDTVLCDLPPSGYVNNNLDCDDNDSNINPLVPEYYPDGIDNDCDGVVDEEPNYSLDFDGTDDYIDLSNIPSSSNYSIEFWMKSQSNSSTLIYSNSSQASSAYRIDISSGRLRMRYGTSSSIFYLSGVLNQDEWYHFALVREGPTSVSSYINGIHYTTTNLFANLAFDSEMLLGTNGNAKTNFFNGQIDEFRVWNGPRTHQEIQDNMLKELSGNEPNLVAYYKFDDDQALFVDDCTVNQFDGIKRSYDATDLPQADISQVAGLVDKTCLSCANFTLYRDFDGDGYGDSNVDTIHCEYILDGYVQDNTDCNDNDALVNISSLEVADGIDNNCNGEIDEAQFSLDFDGADDYVDLSYIPASNNYSIEFWIKIEDVSDEQFILSSTASNHNTSYRIRTDNSRLYMYYGTSSSRFDISDILQDGEWNHVVINRDGPTSVSFLYQWRIS